MYTQFARMERSESPSRRLHDQLHLAHIHVSNTKRTKCVAAPPHRTLARAIDVSRYVPFAFVVLLSAPGAIRNSA